MSVDSFHHQNTIQTEPDFLPCLSRPTNSIKRGLKEISADVWLSLLVLLIFDALANPYAGIAHDAILYALQALWHIHPGRYDQDLFFLFGSQNAYTVFSPVYALFIKTLGLSVGSFVFYILTKALLFLSILLFFRQFSKNRSIAFLAAAIISLHDIHYIFFDINEAFLTPRLAALSLSLFALKAVLQHHFTQTVLFLLLSALFHPIMAVGAGIIVCITWIFCQEWRFLFFSVAILFGSCFTLFILHPVFFQNLNIMQEFDPQWRSIVLERAPYLFPEKWPINEWKLLFTSTTIALISCFFLAKPPKKMIIAAIAAIGLCLFSTFIFTYLFSLSFPIQIQPWRAFWILRILNPVLCVVLAFRLWEKNNFWHQLAAAIIIITALMGGGIGSEDFLWIFPIIILCILPTSWANLIGYKTKRLIFLCILGILLFIPLSTILINVNQISGHLQWLTGMPIIIHTIGPVFPIMICLVFLYCRPQIPKPLTTLVYFSFFMILCIPGVNPNMDYVTSDKSKQPLYKYHLPGMCKKDNQNITIPPGSLIIPQKGVSPSKVWFELQSACYWSIPQGAGVIFNRKLAIEYDLRQREMKQAEKIGFCHKDNILNLKKNPTIYVVSHKKLHQTKSSKNLEK